MLAVLLFNRRLFTKRRRITVSLTEVVDNTQCRTCLATDEELIPLFPDEETALKRSYELKLITGLDIKMKDGLSQMICRHCIDSLYTAVKFRKVSRKAHKALLNDTLTNGINEHRNDITLKNMLNNPTVVNKFSHLEPSIGQNEYMDYGDVYGDDYQTYEDDIETQGSKPKTKPIEKKVAKKKRNNAVPGFKCKVCKKEFRMKATYLSHMRFHTNFCVCESCGKRCRNNNQLQEHKRARHGLGRIHKCAYCEYSSATKEALTIHERRHTGERPYICDHCGASFHRRSNLVQHIAIHLPDKNFQCDMCPKRLKSRKFLQIHRHNAHTGRRYGYLCAVCGHAFEKPNKVRAHTRRVHAVPDEHQGRIVRVLLTAREFNGLATAPGGAASDATRSANCDGMLD